MSRDIKKVICTFFRIMGALIFILGGILQNFRVVCVAYLCLLISWRLLENLAKEGSVAA